MYKVLLVDDEDVDLEWLRRRVPWNDLGLEIIAANSGYVALHVIQEESVDILLSDIKMPVITGLELAKKARELQPKIKIAFISGHEDFEYAKKAIEVNAYGYVLKPINDSELMGLLKAIIDRLDEEHRTSTEQRSIKQTLQAVKDEIVNQWLEGKTGRIDLQLVKQYGMLFEKKIGPLVIIEIDDVEWKLSQLASGQGEEKLEQVSSIITRILVQEKLGYFYRQSLIRFVLIPVDLELERLKKVLNGMISSVRLNSQLTVTIGMGRECSSVEELSVSYKQAVQALDYKMFVGKSMIIMYELTKEDVQENAINLDEKLENVFNAVLNYELVSIVDHLDDLFVFFKNLRTRVSVYNITVHFITRLDSLLLKSGENLYDILGLDIKDLDIVFKFETVDDIKTWLMNRLFELSELLMNKKRSQDRKIIYDIRRYALEHLEEKTTLKDVAYHLGFSPNYLGHIFKEATGENFTDFLMRMRLEKACEYLLDPRMKIYEITERIGYKNILYFNRQFKDYYGFTPSEYRKKNKV